MSTEHSTPEKYILMKVSASDSGLQEALPELAELAYEHFELQGLEEFALEEESIDKILGVESYCGGDVSLEVISRLESQFLSSAEGTSVKFYFLEGPGLEAALLFKEYLITHFPSWEIIIESQESMDWDAEWKKHYHPIVISADLMVVPSFYPLQELPDTNLHRLHIYPGSGFGTGNHETTYLCLKSWTDLLSEHPHILEQPIFDFGCGSGILGIATLVMGAHHVDFLDIDLQALKNCLQNFEENGIDPAEHLVVSEKTELPPELQYGLIFANILQNILLEEKDFILERLCPNGYLVLSGILIDQIPLIEESYLKSGLELTRKYIKNDWAALVFCKKSLS